MKALVTGGLGFLGLKLCARMRVAGDIVNSFDILGGDNVLDTQHLDRHMIGCELVVHMAALNGSTQGFYERPMDVLSLGVRGALSVIEAAQRANVPDLIVLSSSEVYGEPAIVPTPETAPLIIPDPSNPRFSYAASKIVTEIAALSATGFRKVQVVRPFNVYGEGQGLGHVIPDLIAQRANGAGAILQGDGTETRSFCHVDDFVDGLLLMYGRGKSGVYNIGNDEEISIFELAKCLIDHISNGEAAHGSPRRRCPDISKMRALGYEPKVSLTDGLARLIR